MTRRRTSRRFALPLKIAVSVVLLLLLTRRIDFPVVFHDIASADRRLLLFAAIIFFASNLLGAVQWRALLGASGVRVSMTRTIVYYLQGLFFGLFLPANVGGDVSRVYDTTRHTGEFGGSLAATVMDRLVGFCSIGGLAVVALVLMPGRTPPPPITLPIVGFAFINAFVLLALFSRRASERIRRLVGRLPNERSRTLAVGVVEALHALRRKPGLLSWVFLLSAVVQVSRIFVHYHVSMAMGIPLSLRPFFVIIPVLAVLVALPISFGGLGVRESAAIELFGHVGVDPSKAVAMQLTVFALSILINLPGWFMFVARQVRTGRIGTNRSRSPS